MQQATFRVVSCIGDVVRTIEVPYDGSKRDAYERACAEFAKLYPRVGTCGQCGDTALTLEEPEDWMSDPDDWMFDEDDSASAEEDV
jgi:hypothetical protein